MLRRSIALAVLAPVALWSAACGGGDGFDASSPSTTSAVRAPDSGDEVRFPDVLAAEVTESDGSYTIAATISSPYDSEDRYADAFRVVGPDGAELWVRELTHPHADEQPFTRTLAGIEIPEGITEVTVEGRDLRNGWGGATAVAAVPGR